MPTKQFAFSLHTSLIFVLLTVSRIHAQATGEGNIPTEAYPQYTPSVSASQATKGSRPTNYYSSVYPQVTLPSSAEATTSASSGSSSNNKSNVILGVVLSLSIAVILIGSLLFYMRYRRHHNAMDRQRRVSWIAKSGPWSPEQKQDYESTTTLDASSLHLQKQNVDSIAPTLPPPASMFGSSRRA